MMKEEAEEPDCRRRRSQSSQMVQVRTEQLPEEMEPEQPEDLPDWDDDGEDEQPDWDDDGEDEQPDWGDDGADEADELQEAEEPPMKGEPTSDVESGVPEPNGTELLQLPSSAASMTTRASDATISGWRGVGSAEQGATSHTSAKDGSGTSENIGTSPTTISITTNARPCPRRRRT